MLVEREPAAERVVDGAGFEVGPDLASVKDKSPESLLVAVEDAEPDEGVVPETPPVQSTEDMTAEQLQRYLSNLRPEDFGKFNI